MNKFILAKKALGRPVMAVETAERIGKLVAFGVDPQARQVTTIVYKDGRKHYIVDWDTLAGVGQDAIMVSDLNAVKLVQTPVEERTARGQLGLLGLTTYSELGNSLGKIINFEFNAKTGQIIRIETQESMLDGEMLVSAGPMGAVVSLTVDPVADMTFVPYEKPEIAGELDAVAYSTHGDIPVGKAVGSVASLWEKEQARQEGLRNLVPESAATSGEPTIIPDISVSRAPTVVDVDIETVEEIPDDEDTDTLDTDSVNEVVEDTASQEDEDITVDRPLRYDSSSDGSEDGSDDEDLDATIPRANRSVDGVSVDHIGIEVDRNNS